jgi:hypothetical protein
MADEITVNVKPLISESSTSESTAVAVVMDDMKEGTLRIPDYQRDTNQWDDATKSLFIESIINNLTIPAFFFEVTQENGIEVNEVIDGQQRLTTLDDFFQNRFSLVKSDEAAYLSPNSMHYADKRFNQLPIAYQQAFKRYRLTVIKLRQLGNMKLEIFRRINQGGTPLSGQDIRLAYYGESSPSVAFIRLAGIYDSERPGSIRFIKSAESAYRLQYPWKRPALDFWQEWWDDKEIARGQTASESFLYGLVVANYLELDRLLSNSGALAKLNIRFSGSMDEALDACIAQFQYQDKNPEFPPYLTSHQQMVNDYYPLFSEWIVNLLGRQSPNLPVSKHRMVSQVFGAIYAQGIRLPNLRKRSWEKIVDFIRRPSDVSADSGIDWPSSKGRWDGKKGYRAQFEAIHVMVKKICQ